MKLVPTALSSLLPSSLVGTAFKGTEVEQSGSNIPKGASEEMGVDLERATFDDQATTSKDNAAEAAEPVAKANAAKSEIGTLQDEAVPSVASASPEKSSKSLENGGPTVDLEQPKELPFVVAAALKTGSVTASAATGIFETLVVKPTDFMWHSTVGISPFDAFRPWTVGNPTQMWPRKPYEHPNPEWFDEPPKEYIYKCVTTKQVIGVQTESEDGSSGAEQVLQRWTTIVRDSLGNQEADPITFAVKEAGTTTEPYFIKPFGEWEYKRKENTGAQTHISISRWDGEGLSGEKEAATKAKAQMTYVERAKEAAKALVATEAAARAKDVALKLAGTSAGQLVNAAATWVRADQYIAQAYTVIDRELDLNPVIPLTDTDRVIIPTKYKNTEAQVEPSLDGSIEERPNSQIRGHTDFEFQSTDHGGNTELNKQTSKGRVYIDSDNDRQPAEDYEDICDSYARETSFMTNLEVSREQSHQGSKVRVDQLGSSQREGIDRQRTGEASWNRGQADDVAHSSENLRSNSGTYIVEKPTAEHLQPISETHQQCIARRHSLTYGDPRQANSARQTSTECQSFLHNMTKSTSIDREEAPESTKFEIKDLSFTSESSQRSCCQEQQPSCLSQETSDPRIPSEATHRTVSITAQSLAEDLHYYSDRSTNSNETGDGLSHVRQRSSTRVSHEETTALIQGKESTKSAVNERNGKSQVNGSVEERQTSIVQQEQRQGSTSRQSSILHKMSTLLQGTFVRQTSSNSHDDTRGENCSGSLRGNSVTYCVESREGSTSQGSTSQKSVAVSDNSVNDSFEERHESYGSLDHDHRSSSNYSSIHYSKSSLQQGNTCQTIGDHYDDVRISRPTSDVHSHANNSNGCFGERQESYSKNASRQGSTSRQPNSANASLPKQDTHIPQPSAQSQGNLLITSRQTSASFHNSVEPPGIPDHLNAPELRSSNDVLGTRNDPLRDLAGDVDADGDKTATEDAGSVVLKNFSELSMVPYKPYSPKAVVNAAIELNFGFMIVIFLTMILVSTFFHCNKNPNHIACMPMVKSATTGIVRVCAYMCCGMGVVHILVRRAQTMIAKEGAVDKKRLALAINN
ncbi:hypothetical protein BJ742DRAFT_766109 [Cladochytrium replicatum]|nr:hypothetical protein BJ742DRAFT_766109 [Cladochytrium replicatum]